MFFKYIDSIPLDLKIYGCGQDHNARIFFPFFEVKQQYDKHLNQSFHDEQKNKSMNDRRIQRVRKIVIFFVTT